MRLRLSPLRLLNGRPAPTAPEFTDPPVPTTTAVPDISAALRKSIQTLYVSHISPAGVDYAALNSSPHFASYVRLTAHLRTLDLLSLLPDDTAKIAFFVNIYNALTQHAIVALRPPLPNSLSRLLFAMSVAYRVGPFIFSLNDIENGILRANHRISVLPRPFSATDPRLQLAVSRVDPRIHFVLNCAATSCPPILFLTPQNLDSSLILATLGFLANESNFVMRSSNNVCLSMIFRWYRSDFSADGSQEGLLKYICSNGDQNQQSIQQLQLALKSDPQNVTISWLPYDWTLNNAT